MPNGLIALPIVAGMQMITAVKTGEGMMKVMDKGMKKKKGNPNHKKKNTKRKSSKKRK